ncbi:hypothetical protein EV702DRAFT_1078944 [Suillus placidus]|uniref:Uncharacterized protein n=1 Tax=Suillus placidus TaxID=48579 RepID=A0A9P7A201_9AGAM|nr:hypothetical protein EV702DRAFT_1078944 [Suillus placidus]
MTVIDNLTLLLVLDGGLGGSRLRLATFWIQTRAIQMVNLPDVPSAFFFFQQVHLFHVDCDTAILTECAGGSMVNVWVGPCPILRSLQAN